MQKAPVMKGSGLAPVEESKSNEVVHVFGMNLEARVVATTEEQEQSTSAEIKIEDPKVEEDIESIRKRKFEAVTGEEDEETVFQGEFKLFAWDLATSNWIEKGRGQLKLNDSIDPKENKSRLIMRLSGTLRIILNVAIRNSFKVVACTKTNIRFSDSQSVWAASGPNTHQLKDLIEERLKRTVDEVEERKKENEEVSNGEKEKKEEEVDTKEEKDIVSKEEPEQENKDEGGQNEKQDGEEEVKNDPKDENKDKEDEEAVTEEEAAKIGSKRSKPDDDEIAPTKKTKANSETEQEEAEEKVDELDSETNKEEILL